MRRKHEMLNEPVIFGRFIVNSTQGREYFEIYKKISPDSNQYRCLERTQTALGQHFLDFLENSEKALHPIVEHYNKVFKYLDKDYLDQTKIHTTMDFIIKIYENLSGVHPFWRSTFNLNPVLTSYKWYEFYYLREYMNFDASDITEADRDDKMQHYWEQVRKNIMHELKELEEFQNFISSMRNAVTFCLDYSSFLEFSKLHTQQRAYLYQSHFDSNFMRNQPIQNIFNLSDRASALNPDRKIHFSNNNDVMVSSIISNANYYELIKKTKTSLDFSALAASLEKTSIETTTNLDITTLEDIKTICLYTFSLLVSNNVHVRPCKNCGRLFSPYNRKDELYCSRTQANSKTCREDYYDKQIHADELIRYYRTAYKRENARKQRNIINKPSSEKEFTQWAKKAKKALEKAKKGDLSFDEFKKILDREG